MLHGESKLIKPSHLIKNTWVLPIKTMDLREDVNDADDVAFLISAVF